MDWLEITAIGMIAGVLGNGIGGLFSFFIRKTSTRFMGTILGFSAGVMLSIIFLELLQESMDYSGHWYSVAGIFIGLVAFFILDFYIPHHHAVTSEESYKGDFLKKGILLAIGISFHNLPEGLAIGVGFRGSLELGLTLSFLIALHNIPEGMAVAVSLKYGGYPLSRVLAITALSGVPMGIGALAGALIGVISPVILGLLFGFAAGAMLYIVCDELIPDAYQSAGAHFSILGIFFGVAVGIIFSASL